MEENVTVASFEAEHLKILKEYLERFYNLWKEFGLGENEQIVRVQLIWKYIEGALQGALDDELVQYKILEDEVRIQKQVMEKLCALLSVTPKEEFGTGLIEQKENLSQEIKKLKELKHERLKRYQGLRGVEAVYCRILGVDKIALTSFTGVPSENNLLEIEKHIQKLSKLQDDRQKRFCQFRKELSTIFEETEITPETPFEQEVISCDSAASLSDETFKSLEEVFSTVQKKKGDLEDQKKMLLNKLSNLWEELCIPSSDRMQFLSDHVDCRVSTINALQNEVEICEKIKEEKVKNHLKTLKEGLKKLWDKCYVTDSVKKCFAGLIMGKTTEETINAYEREYNKWKDYYEEASDILVKVEKRQELWDKLMELEENVTNPVRLKNRGGKLLLEEKERKKIQKELPPLEDSIFSDIDLYQSKVGKPFLFYGEDYRNYITRQWQDRRNRKDDEKLERLRRHSTEMDKEILLATPIRKPLQNSPRSAPCNLNRPDTKIENNNNCTPLSRRFDAIASSFKNLVLPKEQINPALNDGIRGKLFSSSSSTSGEEEQNNAPKELIGLHMQPNQSSCTTYSEFADELDSTVRCDLRSSVLPTKKITKKKSPFVTPKNRRRSLSKPVSKSVKSSRGVCTPSPVRGKLGLPFLM